ncbi:hypothetical protein ES288_D10G193800v1 [Gossypium darwinii]|uniref:Protein kinase domain-containing protein n=1 Tax=Gossypium darwinii TaxID=34276 RepID=A0A5D2B087_GOSDA|nr:hypothetical protein ES288_D10G193800v1 [Gossypium darwinii]
MELSRKHMVASNSRFLVYIEVIVLLSYFSLPGLNLLGLASPVVRGNDIDRQALLHFKSKIIGDQLKVMESWNSSIHFCHWHGVTCGRRHQRVTKLELEYLKLTGSLSPYIGNLSFLREFSLAGNNFYNQIPREIDRLRRLEILILTNNSISVEIEGNQLTGEIPTFLGLLSNFKYLSFAYNSLRGSIPPSLGNLSSLETLALTRNSLSGIIREALEQLTDLSYFSIEDNAISGTVPVAMFNLSNIIIFSIGGNKIQGTLPSDLAITMPYVNFFSVRENQISGKIPVSISNASNLNILQFEGNRLDGDVHSLEKLDKLFAILLDANHFGHGGEGDLHFLCTLVNNTKLEVLVLSENNFGGVFPECISNFSTTLLHLVLGISQNQLSGPIPIDIGRLQKLTIFDARINFLNGTIPYSIGNLTMLTKLALDFNNLQGNLSSSLGECQNLLEMGLSHNNLGGPIPPQILGLPSMSISLDLSSNNLTGDLPVAVEQLKHLSEFHVSQNRLSGLLPNKLGNCVSLEKLFLDGNLFEGPIPLYLSSLRGLEALDVSNNNLSGRVPEFLVSFRALKYLNISFNDFEGVILSERVFKNASATFVEGNNKLCGGIPELHLLRCNSKTSSNTSLRLIIAVVVVVLGVSSIPFFVLIMRFRKKKEQQPTTTCAENSLLHFDFVYKGVLEENRAFIAVRSFLAECEALKHIRHRNLVKVLTAISGFDYQGNDFKALVYEFMENGSLGDWLHRSTGMHELETTRKLNFFQRVNVAIDPSNILLDEEMVGHISDFGLAKIFFGDKLNYSTNQSSSFGLRGTVGYAPPEYGMGSELSTKGDVYSYGILLLEMFTGKRPIDERFKEGLSIRNFVEAALPERMIEIIDPILLQERVRRGTIADIILSGNNLRNDRHFWCSTSILDIELACSFESPSERMDMSDVVIKLCSIRNKLYPTRLRREGQT